MKKTFAGISLKNHLVAASSPLTESSARVSCCRDAGFGAAILKSTAEYTPNTETYGRKVIWEKDCYYADGSLESEILPLQDGFRLYCESAALADDMLLIPSVCAFSLEPEKWIQVCQPFVDIGVHIIQMDLFYLTKVEHTTEFYTDFGKLMQMLSMQLPCTLMPKLNMGFEPETTCAVLAESNISHVSLLDSIKKTPPTSYKIHPESTSCFGRFQLPYTLKYLDSAIKYGLTVCAGGGVESKEDAELLLTHGATLVQVASYALRKGYSNVPKLLGQESCHELTHRTWCDVEDGGVCNKCGGCLKP